MTLSKFNGLAVEAPLTAPEIVRVRRSATPITAGTSAARFRSSVRSKPFDRNRITQADQPWARCSQQLRVLLSTFTTAPKCFPIQEAGVTVNTIGTGSGEVPS